MGSGARRGANGKGTPRSGLSEAGERALIRAANGVWDEIAWDAIEMCGGKAKRSDVVELVSDAGRLDDALEREIERLRETPRSTAFYEPDLAKREAVLAATVEALEWWKSGSERESRLRIVRKAFPASAYVI